VEPMEVDLEDSRRQYSTMDENSFLNDEEEWASGIENLDEFFTRLYTYYYEKGFSSIMTKALVNTVTLGFTTVFSTFLLGFLDWNALLDCHSESSCLEFSQYLRPLSEHSSVAFQVFVVAYAVVFSLYWLWTLIYLIPTMSRNWQIRQFYSKRLDISTRELQTMEWSDIVNKVIAVQDSGISPIQINGMSFTAKEISMRILRKENYLIAMINEEVLPVGTFQFGSQWWYFGKNLELMIEVCVLNQLYSSSFKISRSFLTEPELLRKRFVTWGCINFLMMPFTLGFMLIYSFLKYAEEFHSKKNYLGPRWWSPYALWEFREYNELQHILDKRTLAGVKPADQYLKQFPSPVPTMIATGVSFIAGAFVAILMLFTIMDESIVLYVKLGGRDLVWYIAIFSGVLAISRAFIPPIEETVFNPDKVMRRVVSYTHYMPDHWRPNTHSYNTRDEFSDFFQFKVVLLVQEMICILTTPYVLCFVLPRYSQIITEFIRSRTENVEGVGDVCVYSQLNLSTHGDSKYGSQLMESNFIHVKKVATRGGKLEKSWLNFQRNYPASPQQEENRLDQTLLEFQKQDMNNDESLSLDKYPNSENYFYWLERFRDQCT